MVSSSIRPRGFAHERDLVLKFWEKGLAVVRAPASGSKTKRIVYPDIVAIYKGRVVVIEAKTMSEPRDLYIDEDRIERLQEFARRASGEVYIATKIVGTGKWVFHPLNQLVRTESGRYKLPRELVDKGLKLEDLVSVVKGVHRLDEYTGGDRTRTSRSL